MAVDDSEGHTDFVYDGPDSLKLLQERDADDALVAQYVMGSGLSLSHR